MPLDIDVKGALNVKRILHGDRALTLYIKSHRRLMNCVRRLEGRATDAPEVIEERVGKAAYELTFAPQYDCSVVNDRLDDAVEGAHRIIRGFHRGATDWQGIYRFQLTEA